MAFGPASRLGVALFEDTDPIDLWPSRSNEEVEAVIRAVYKQVLGNAYVMESERLSVPESQLKGREISLREFVRQVGKSELYRSLFFDSTPRYRAIELNFRHFLGRAPLDLEETRTHSTILDTKGFEAEIDSYLDSDEYQENFGENIVPYIRGYKTEAIQSLVQFTHLFQLVRGSSSSSLKGDLAGKQPKLNSLVIQSTPTAVISPASKGAAFRNPVSTPRTRQGVGASEDGKVYRVEVTGYKANVVNNISKFRRSNQVFFVPYNQLSQEYQRIHKQGGVIASITPVN
ncbi:photosystem I reaction center subunit XII [Nostoc sp. 'Peltigera membranacea cyanobiont' 213]|uniref:phycobilisome linker polypeptide n=1 Tax=Nostoc cyanobionts TaxID=3123326 RepID=UPI000B9557FA|nr:MULTISPECIES: phycobilisome linker polypeptide [unclassified Nostoc]AVH64424.1 phycobilisome linker polypeptide CpcD [Nostoc sp. 'Peltigera membranacea cyanobiont' N6]OYD92248.1 photosystem I reaction center subunit XII [Nostoc sp. 'Peltigera membranacea cyanobiont' 213]